MLAELTDAVVGPSASAETNANVEVDPITAEIRRLVRNAEIINADTYALKELMSPGNGVMTQQILTILRENFSENGRIDIQKFALAVQEEINVFIRELDTLAKKMAAQRDTSPDIPRLQSVAARIKAQYEDATGQQLQQSAAHVEEEEFEDV